MNQHLSQTLTHTHLYWSDAKAVIRRLEGEMGGVRDAICEGEEAVARLRGKLEEVQEREETSQVQLAHAIAQVEPSLAVPTVCAHCLCPNTIPVSAAGG